MTTALMTCIVLAAAAATVESSCTSASSKLTECMAPMLQGASSGGDVCGAWNTFERCLVDSVAACGADMQEQVKSIIASTKSQYENNPLFAGLAGCAAAAPPAEATTALVATISFDDPLKFDLKAYEDAAKKHTGASAVEAVLSSLEILVKYALPASASIPLSDIKAAIAKANSVLESQISLETSESRRLNTQRLLAASDTILDVTIAVPDADTATAAKVKETASDVKGLESELGVKVSISKEPVAVAKVATTLTSDPATSSTLESKLAEVGSEIGGTVEVAAVTTPPVSQTSFASSTFLSKLAPIMALVAAVVAAM